MSDLIEYLRGVAENANLPQYMRDRLTEAADALEAAREDAARWRAWRELDEHAAADIAWLNAGEERDAALDAMQQGGGGE